MNERILLFEYGVMIATTIIGIVRYRHLDKALRLIPLLCIITAVVEILAYVATLSENTLVKGALYHAFNPVEVVFISAYFAIANRFRYRNKFIFFCLVCWPVIGILNVMFLQPMDELNSNFLVLESFAIITMSLYTIYNIIKQDADKNIFLNPHFQVAVLLLVAWSSTFFFWAFVKLLYSSHWRYIGLAINMNLIINTIIYIGFSGIFLRYPKSIKSGENS